MPEERAQPWSVAVPHLLEGQLVHDGIFNDQDVRLLQNLPHAGPVAVQQILEKSREEQMKGQRRRDGTDTSLAARQPGIINPSSDNLPFTVSFTGTSPPSPSLRTLESNPTQVMREE